MSRLIFDTTLICSVHHRRSPPFEEGMRRLASVGFKHIWILESGKCKWGPYQGPYERIVDVQNSPLHGAIKSFWTAESIPEHIDQMILLDNDLFIIDPQDTVEYVTAFREGEFDLATLSSFSYPKQNETGDILIQVGLDKVWDQLTPGGIAYSVWRKQFWERLPPLQELFSLDGVNFWKRIVDLNPKLGIHRMDLSTLSQEMNAIQCRSYSQFENGKWLHLGNLMTSYFEIEEGREAKGDLRRGYFCKYFPKKVKYSDEEREQYINIWNQFTNNF